MNKILTIRDTQVMIGRDLVELCAVGIKRLNEQVKRNIERFLEKFRFRFIVLRGKIAIEVSIKIIDLFATMRRFISNNVDDSEVSYVEASLKGFGKKGVAFSKMDMASFEYESKK